MPASTALGIIDAQEAFFSGPDAVYQASTVLGRIQRLREHAQRAAVPVIYVPHDGAPDSTVAPGSAGWQIPALVAPAAIDSVVRKRASAAFFATTLQHELQARGVGHVVLVGYTTPMCVDTTSRRATSLGCDVTLVSDAHTTTQRWMIAGRTRRRWCCRRVPRASSNLPRSAGTDSAPAERLLGVECYRHRVVGCPQTQVLQPHRQRACCGRPGGCISSRPHGERRKTNEAV